MPPTIRRGPARYEEITTRMQQALDRLRRVAHPLWRRLLGAVGLAACGAQTDSSSVGADRHGQHQEITDCDQGPAGSCSMDVHWQRGEA
jgi:hypothetical protein